MSRSRARLLLPVAIALGAGALYAETRVLVHRFDAVTYMLAAASDDPARWFNPHHLLYVWLARGVAALVGAASPGAAMAWVSAVAAAAALAVQAALLGALIPGAGWTLAGSALLGLSGAFWVSATEPDVYALTVATLVGAAASGVRAAATGRTRWHAAAGVLTALSILVHQLAVLFALAYAASLAFAGRGGRPRALGAFLVPAVGVSAAAYLGIGVAFGLFADPASFLAWATTYGRSGYWGIFRARNLVDGLYGLLYALAPGAGGLVPPLLVRAVSALGLAAAAWGVWRWTRATWPSAPHRAASTLCLAWLAAYVPFIVWYAPFHTPLWLLVLPPLGLLLAGAGAAAARAPSPGRRGAALALGVVLAVGALSYVRVVWPLTRPENDVETRFAARALATLPADARVVAPIGVAAQLLAERLGRDAVFVVPHAPSARETRAEVLARLSGFVAGARRAERPTFVFASLLGPAPAGSRWSDAELRRAVSAFLAAAAGAARLGVLDTAELAQPLRRHPLDPTGRGAAG